jgi:dienelactone hydrolase
MYGWNEFFLKQQRDGKRIMRKIGFVGYSFGGSAVMQAVVIASDVASTAVTLAIQSYGAVDVSSKLKHGNVSLLLFRA